MTIPPFPSQDLAKLVLGYLAEEQLMTAYDEFLQASPYLDAFQNEYDRIFMTSLKSILAEYRAVKIYVETCKPILLRKKIFQYTNLLDIVKFLVTNVDHNKIQTQESVDRSGSEKHQLGENTNKTNTCETCVSLKLVNCVCKLKTQPSGNQSSHVGESLQTSVETTLLADLPGNHVTTRKKQIKVLDKDSVFLSDDQSENELPSRNISMEENSSSHSVSLKSDSTIVTLNSTVKEIDLAESRQKIEEFNNVLKSVVDKNNTVTGSENVPSQRVSNASTFQDFTSGVSGRESQNPNVPDSSTSESLSILAPLNKDYYKDNVIESQKRQLLLQVSHRNDKIEFQTCKDSDKILKYSQIRVKPDDQKVKILSDVKVTNKKKTLKNATSTPLIQMKTVVINGTQAYKQTPVVTNHTYTKDEIMAMPTLIVVPASGSSKILTNSQPVMTLSCNATTNTSSTSRPLSPLVIDVPPTPAIIKHPEGMTQLSDLKLPDLSEAGLVKTIDLTKNASVPKDNVTSATTKTPQVLPPVRKSSSTPRRTTHVRVLDFTTPRRILHESINEQVTSQTDVAPVEIVLSSSPNISFVDTNVAGNTVNNNTAEVYSNIIVQKADGCDTDTASAKENTTVNKPKQTKKDWDADLRAVLANDASVGSSVTHRRKSTKKKKATIKTVDTTGKNKLDSNIISPNIKKASKKRQKVVEEEDDAPPSVDAIKADVPVKPTINIISGSDRVTADAQIVRNNNKDNEMMQNKSNDLEDDCAETPEADRLSLQNIIGTKLNISDLLETPYKQALYDIQMGTPRFLPDLPGEPLSDIKITNIPTPRFLDTPKPVQATPSSWSSRPTDYSSGGSYYKPDDQDYMPIPDLRCAVSSSSKEDITLDKSIEITKDNEKKSRPQRKCAKNVSYYKLAGVTYKTKVADDTIDAISTCSDSTGSNEYKHQEPIVKTPRDRSKSNKSVTKKRVSNKKSKSPAAKDKTKPVLKIKPRQTPTKLTPKNRKKIETPGYISLNKHRRNRTTSKDKNENSPAPLLVAAPTKSRRKSSTPRKLHCTKSFNSENSNHTSPETIINTKQNASRDAVPSTQDSDTEQIALRWSDDGSQDTKIKEVPTTSKNDCEDIFKIQKYIQNTRSNNDARNVEDISKIREYIQTTGSNYMPCNEEDISKIQEYIETTGPNNGSHSGGQVPLQVNLIQRGFDVETAKKIERELLDVPTTSSDHVAFRSLQVQMNLNEPALDKSSSGTNDLQILQDDTEEEDEVEFSVHDCNEDSENYLVVHHDDTKEMSQGPPVKLKDKFSINICVSDGVTVRLRATPFNFTHYQDPIGVEQIDYRYNDKETEMAVSSISNMQRLYTPLKESFKAQCYEIFDSTLTSLDTPLKANSPKKGDCETTATEIAFEEERSQKALPKKRQRSSGSDESTSDRKKTKYLLTTASIQNIDIESVLTKLHGP